MKQNALKIDQLSVNYGATPALWDISLTVPQKQLVGIIGPNGAGKSTLVKTALGLLKPLSGKITFFDQPLHQIKRKIAYIPQKESVDWNFPLTVRELIIMGRFGKIGLCRRPRHADWEAAEMYINKLDLSSVADRQIGQLSGGQQQKAFVARALMQDADVYFFDEPFIGIDLGSRATIIHALKKLREDGKTLFIIHHELSDVDILFDWIILLNIRLIACGPKKETFTPENLNAAYGKNYALFDEALKLSLQKKRGF